MARKKSLDDIASQYSRILSSARRSGNTKRAYKAQQIYKRYRDNILNTKSGSKNRAEAGDPNLPYEQRWAADERLATRKYSQRTYMGAANG